MVRNPVVDPPPGYVNEAYVPWYAAYAFEFIAHHFAAVDYGSLRK
jgi:hypothetical protein